MLYQLSHRPKLTPAQIPYTLSDLINAVCNSSLSLHEKEKQQLVRSVLVQTSLGFSTLTVHTIQHAPTRVQTSLSQNYIITLESLEPNSRAACLASFPERLSTN